MIEYGEVIKINATDTAVYIGCASFEDRSLGFVNRLSSEVALLNSVVFAYSEPNERREQLLALMKQKLSKHGPYPKVLRCSRDTPTTAVHEFAITIAPELRESGARILLDISTFTRRHLLIFLQAIDHLQMWDQLSIFYTEPDEYSTDVSSPMSIGVRNISAIPGFSLSTSVSKNLLLVLMIGHERDRAMAVYSHIDPSSALIIAPRPAYRLAMEGGAEKLNEPLINIVGSDSLHGLHSLDPVIACDQLSQLLSSEFSPDEWSTVIAPLGTKPQTVASYLYWREHRQDIAMIYAQPLEYNHLHYTKGIGITWELLASH